MVPTKTEDRKNNIFVIDFPTIDSSRSPSKIASHRQWTGANDPEEIQQSESAPSTPKSRRAFNTRSRLQPKSRHLPLPFRLAFVGIIYPSFYIYHLERTIPNGGIDDLRSGRSTTSAELEGEDYEVVTTNYGWNGKHLHNFTRRIITGEFFNATLAHPRYNATAWADLDEHPDPKRRIVAFLDVDTCLEHNYPIYGGRDWWKNLEEGYRIEGHSHQSVVMESCAHIRRAAVSPALLANPDSRLVLLDCSGSNKLYLRNKRVCGHDGKYDRQVMTAYTSVKEKQPWDVGLPPPAIKPVTLSPYERYQVKECSERKYLFSFQGQAKHYFGRNELLNFQHYDDMFVRLRHQNKYLEDIRLDGGDAYNYGGILKESHFGAAPRGDNLFSYRFSEVLSAGAVPVVYADGWKPPFHERVVNWTDCAVFIPESDYNRTRDILLSIPDDVRCRMQRRALEVWDTYVSSRAGWVRGLVESAIS